MIEPLVLLLIASPFVKLLIDDEIANRDRIARETNRPRPGLSSQHFQIKPLTPAQIALGKKPYLGPRKPRATKRKKS